MVARIYLGLLVAIVLLQLGHTEKLNKLLYKSCLEGYSNIKNITVFPCNAIGNRLYIQHGKEYKMFVEFVSKQTSEVTQLKPTLHGKIGKNWLALPLDDKYTEILKKPLKEGAVHTYEMTFPVLRGYPLTKFMAKMELSDQNKNKIKCFTFPLEIVGEMWKSKTSKEESCQLYQKN